MPDYDDCQKMRELGEKYSKITALKNKAVSSWTFAEVKLNIGIVDNNISDKWTWKKQVLELCKLFPEYIEWHTNFYKGKADERMYTGTLKAVDNEINILKKIYQETPK